MLALTLKDLPKNRREFTLLYQNQDWNNLRKSVHKLHSAVSYCGTPQLKICCQLLEGALSEGDLSQEKLSPLFGQLQQAIDAVIEHYEVHYTQSR